MTRLTMRRNEAPAVVMGFSEAEAERLTGVSARQLRYWSKTSFFSPALPGNALTGPLYSFRDLVCLKVLGMLRNQHGVPLPHLREAKENLAHLGEDVWAKATIHVLGKKVVVLDPETGTLEEPVSKQRVLKIPLRVVVDKVDKEVRQLRARDGAAIGKVQRQKGVVHNRPVVAGTRVQVSSIQAFAEAGYSVEQILKEYPSLTAEDVKAALDYAEAA